MKQEFGADRALALRAEPLRVSSLPRFDHGEGRLDADGLDLIEALVADASAAEPFMVLHESGDGYADRIIRRAIQQGTLVLGTPPRGHE